MIRGFRTISSAAALLAVMAASQTAEAGPPDSIPFISSRGKIIVPVTIGDSRELMLLLDTGMPMDGILLYDPSLRAEIDLPGAVEARVGGAGDGPPNMALMADSIDLCAGGMTLEDQRVIMLLSDTMKGFPSDGVIGHSLLGHHTVEIDHERSVMILHDQGSFEPDPSLEKIPITFKDNNIPWLDCAVDTRGDGEVPVSMYIDLASGETIEMLVRTGRKFELPDGLIDTYLGRGLSGDIYGQSGTVVSFTIGSFRLEEMPAAFAPGDTRSKQDGADGVIGNGLLRRFHAVFDYQGRALYLRPNTYFTKPFDQALRR